MVDDAVRLLAEREKRVSDAFALRKPDRVPVMCGTPGPYPAERLGISAEEQMMDIEKSQEAYLQTALYYQADLIDAMPPLGPTLTALGCRHLKWAGHGLPADAGWQVIDEEVMKPEEYDEFIYDPSDFIMRRYWPRAFSRLAALADLPPIRQGQGYFGAPFSFAVFGTPEGREALDALREAGTAALEVTNALAVRGRTLREAGFPASWGAVSSPAFDFVGNFLRGRKGIMLDMFRCPEKLEAAVEKMLPMTIDMALKGAEASRNPRVMIAINGGVEGFMSLDQYKRFYWPGLQQLLVALADAGLNPFVLVEGGSTSRLETMADVPAGKICYLFDHVDMRRAKEVLGHKVCIAGNVPISLLSVGTPDEVRAYCKDLIDNVGHDGGFILAPSGQTEAVRVENVKAMVDFTKEYGRY